MNALDAVLAGLLVIAVVGGVRVGFVARALTWMGVAAGLLAAAWTVPVVLGAMHDEVASLRLLAGIGILAVTVTVCTAVFQTVGTRLRGGTDVARVSRPDRVLGGLAGAAMVAGLVWFLLPAAAQTPGVIATQARESGSLTLARRFGPPPTSATRQLQALLDSSRFPEVWEDLRPVAVVSPPPEEMPVEAAIVSRATASTVHVQARGCGRRYDGSGVTVLPGLVVTNAHVVAGADRVQVRGPGGGLRTATVVRFDPGRDLALLSVDGHDQDPLPLAEITPRADGVSIGYPGGQSQPRAAPLRVEDRRLASGHDIYGDVVTEREVLFLSADLRQGDSGSPVVDEQGRIGGIVFAISPDQDATAYALDIAEVEALIAAPRLPDETGRCLD